MIKPQLTPRLRSTLSVASLAALLALTLGCGLHKARKDYDAGNYEAAALGYRQVLQKDPGNAKARIGYRFAAQKVAELHVDKARQFQAKGDIQRASLELQNALRLDPTNAMALDMLENLEAAKAAAAEADEEENLETLRDQADNRPMFDLNPRSMEGINLNFSKKTSLKEIFAHLSQASGVSILFHNTAQVDQLTIQADLRGLTFQRILDTLMLQSDLFYRVLAPNTIMVFKSTAQNKQQFEPKLQRTFFISNAEAPEIKNTLQSILQEAKLYHDKRMNAIIMRGNPTEIMTAQRIVRSLDKAKSEVMIYVELLEVSESNLERVGLMPVISPLSNEGTYRIGASMKNTATGGLNQNNGGVRITRSDLQFLLPSLALDALKTSGEAKLVASPNVRAASGEQAKIKIGEKVNVANAALGGSPTGTASLPSNLGSMVGGMYPGMAQTQYQFEEVGVNIEVEPRVNLNGDITLKIKTTVTTQTAGVSADRPNIGQRVVETSTRLRDGETAIFGGLIKEDEQKQLQGIWGLSDIPFLGKLLGASNRKRQKTDVILTVRAVQLKRPDLTQADFDTFDPERATSESGHFASRKTTKAKTKPKADAETQATAKTEEPGEVGAEPKAPAEPKPEGTATKPPISAEPRQEAPQTPETPAAPPAAGIDGKGEAKPSETKGSDLVIFCSPTTSTAAKGDRVQIALLVSGGKDFTSGNLEIRPDARLKLAQVLPGDYVTSENGNVLHSVEPNGQVKLSFKRPTAATDSGTLAILEFEVVGGAGNAPILLEKGRYQIGSNPFTGKVVNALVTVE